MRDVMPKHRRDPNRGEPLDEGASHGRQWPPGQRGGASGRSSDIHSGSLARIATATVPRKSPAVGW